MYTSIKRGWEKWRAKFKTPFFSLVASLFSEAFGCSLNWHSSSMITPAPANKICHILPCSIDYDGMAPIHVYFQPSEVQAQFRGRKLLAQPPVAVQGRVIGGRGSHPRGDLTFTQIQEWHHLHDPLLLATANSRVETARTWCQVARAVHEEIPVDD
jgi:hypothetical protein